MKKKIICICLMITLLCVSCDTSENGNEINTHEEITNVLKQASYENLEICFDEIKYYEEQDLVIANTRLCNLGENMTYEEAMEMYIEDIFPFLLDVEKIDKSDIYDVFSHRKDEVSGRSTYGKNYSDILATLDEYDKIPALSYYKEDSYTKLYYSGNWNAGVYMSMGTLGKYANSDSPYGASAIIEDKRTYDCRRDDLSDSYLLMDGEKTVAEAKTEMESYLDAHYPITGKSNGFHNEILKISVGKIKGTEYYAFEANRTISYNGIPIREMPSTNYLENDEFAFLGQCVLCESDKVDITIGIINNYEKPQIVRTIHEAIPFAEVLERVSYYLTGETKFQLLYGGLEYRMFYMEDESIQMVPYWVFIAKNPNDDTTIKIYVDIETGKTTHYDY